LIELKNKENKSEIEHLKEKYEKMISNIQDVDNKKTDLLQNQIKILENQLIETNESQAQIASMQRNFQQQQELNILNIKNDLTKKYEKQLQEIINDRDNFTKKLESEHHLKQSKLIEENSNLQEELIKLKEEVDKKNHQLTEWKTKAEKPVCKDFSQQFDKGLEEKQNVINNFKGEIDEVRLLLYTNINYVDDHHRCNPESPSFNDLDYGSKSHEKYLKSLSLKQLVQTYIHQVNRNNEQISKLKIIDRNKNDYVNEMEKQIKNLEITQKQIMLENQNSIAFVENKYINEINEQKNRYENELLEQKNQYENDLLKQKNQYENDLSEQKNQYENDLLEQKNQCENDLLNLQNKYDEIVETLQQKEEQIEEMASKKTYPETTLAELLEIYPKEFEEFKNEIESVVWKKLDEAWHARFKEDLSTASLRITQHCSEAYSSAIAKLKTQSIAFKNKLEMEFEKKFKHYVEERNKETNHLKHKYEQNQKQIEELKKQLNESKVYFHQNK